MYNIDHVLVMSRSEVCADRMTGTRSSGPARARNSTQKFFPRARKLVNLRVDSLTYHEWDLRHNGKDNIRAKAGSESTHSNKNENQNLQGHG